MKALLVPASLVLLAGTPGQEEIVYEPEEGLVLTRTFEARATFTLEEVSATVGDEELESPEELDYEVESLERIVVTDEILEAEDGRPTDLLRTFDELLQESVYRTSEEEIDVTSNSEMQGRTIRFYWDDEDEEYVVETDDDEDDLDDSTLEFLLEDMDLRLVLPEDEVEEGDEWDIDAAAYLSLMWPGGLLDFIDEGDDEKDPVSREMNEEIIENLDGEGSATLVEIRDEDGVRVAVVSITLEIETWADADVEPEEAPPFAVEIEIDRDIEGELLWNLDGGYAYSGAFTASSELVRTTTYVFETEEGEVELEESQTFAGEIEYTVEIEVAE